MWTTVGMFFFTTVYLSNTLEKITFKLTNGKGMAQILLQIKHVILYPNTARIR